MKNLLIKTCILSLMLFIGFAMATTPPSGKDKAKKEVTCKQHTEATSSAQATATAQFPANLPSWCNPQNCAPASCVPANCDPTTCTPKNCDPKNCNPKNCKPLNCVKAVTSCKSVGSLH